MTTENVDIHWNSQLEKIISDEGERALCYSWLHDKSEQRYRNFNNYITLPTIVLSTVAGTASIGSATIFGDTPYASIGIGIISLTVGVLNTISTHFGWAQRAEAHRVARVEYSKIHRYIMIELSLPRIERSHATDMLKFVREDLDHLLETSPQICPEIIKKFNEKFEGKTDDLSKPNITNGLDPIYIYKEGYSAPSSPNRQELQMPKKEDVITLNKKIPTKIDLKRKIINSIPLPGTVIISPETDNVSIGDLHNLEETANEP